MKQIFLLLCLAAGGGVLYRAGAQTIDLRISVHIIVNPTTGARPSGLSNEVFYTAADNANEWMAGYFRGYRYRVTEVTNVGGPANGGANGPSKWYGLDFRNDPQWSQFQNETLTNTQYRLRSDQINVYVATGFSAPGNSGGGTPIPPGNLSTAAQVFADDGAWWLVHELGHFFGLIHTFAGENQSNCTPGDDGISDTLPDSGCWTTLDLVANYYYSTPYNSLNASQKVQMDNVFYNTMSYHDYLNKNTTENRLSELQLDRESDHANGDRNVFASGRTRFVSTAGSDVGAGTSTSPYRTVARGVTVASSGGNDVLLLRPGSYNEQITISKPVTLRAPRTGWVTIGH
jgi:Pregnancy-associated plasma protein-A